MDRIKFFYIHVGFNAFFMYKSNCFEIVFKNVIRVILIHIRFSFKSYSLLVLFIHDSTWTY